MDIETRRLLELAGILRRRTPDHLLREGDEDEGGDDPFGGDDDSGGDDPFGGGDDDAEGDDAGGDSEEAGGDADIGNRIPPEDLSPRDIERFGSPRFKEVESKLQGFFNQSIKSAAAGAQELETYPGVAIVPADEDQTPAMDDEEKKKQQDEAEEKNESVKFKNRDTWLINEAQRLLVEAEGPEPADSDEFDLEHFAGLVADYMENICNTMDIQGGIFNGARQMILNNYGQQTEEQFCQYLASIDKKWDFKGVYTDGEPEIPTAAGASAEAAGA